MKRGFATVVASFCVLSAKSSPARKGGRTRAHAVRGASQTITHAIQTVMKAFVAHRRATSCVSGCRVTPFIGTPLLAHTNVAARNRRLAHSLTSSCREIKEKAKIGDKVKVQGWVRSIRELKDVVFVDVNDGSQLQNLQVVFPKQRSSSSPSPSSSSPSSSAAPQSTTEPTAATSFDLDQ